MRKIIGIAALLACGTLTCCGNPQPSSKDIQSALQKYMLGEKSKIIDADRIALDSDGYYKQTLTAEKVACKASPDAPGAACDFQVSMCIARGSATCTPKTQTASARFAKTDQGWTYIPVTPASGLARPVDFLDEMSMSDIISNGGAAGN